MMQRFVAALNAVGSQPIAVFVLILGCIMVIVCKRYTLDTSIGAGIIGAAINMLTHDIRKSNSATDGTDTSTATSVKSV